MEKPLLSIICTTYNHEKYIKQTLTGFVNQVTNFPIEIIIHDDASPDRTANIIRSYCDKFPDKFNPIFQVENQASQERGRVTRIVYSYCNAKYIALCEGDDYWTDTNKLQKQVDFLEANPDYSICFHPVKIFKQKDNKIVDDYITRKVDDTTEISDLALGNYMHTASVVFRRDALAGLSDDMLKSPVGDYYLFMHLAKSGEIKKLDDCMAVYRVHEGGIWSLKKALTRYENWMLTLDLLEKCNGDNILVLSNLKIQRIQIVEKAISICVKNADSALTYWVEKLAALSGADNAMAFKIKLEKDLKANNKFIPKVVRRIKKFLK